MKRRVCVITGTRAEYGLLFWVLKNLKGDSAIELQLIVTGMHLSPEFGLTYRQIEADGFQINKKVEILLSSDTPVGISKSMGLAQIGFTEAYSELKPDIVLVLGDRFEVFSAAAAAMISRVPIGHIHGGESTEGLIDEPIRHSITKMSHLHFTATAEYRNRVIQLGENPERVFNVGAPGLDNLTHLELLNKQEFEKSIDFQLGKKNVLVTFHPVTLEENTSGNQFKEVLRAMDHFKDTNYIITKPNADTDGRIIIELIDSFLSKNPKRACAFDSLGQLRYLSALGHVDLVLGNSSSGLTEAPSFNIPTINVGDRQNGRIKAKSVIDCTNQKEAIIKAMQRGFSKNFNYQIQGDINPYGKGGASVKIAEILSSFDIKGILKKEFYNISK
ncbi:UDP-N-acetylglucosamine 2-epimerase [Flagellimonas sp. 2504JD1-5]